MITREDLKSIVIESLKANNGTGRVVDVCKYIWEHYENELRDSGDLFFTWQYDVRWAAQYLRDSGQLKKANNNRSAPWELS